MTEHSISGIISGIQDENGRGHSCLEKATNDSPGLRQVEPGSQAPLCGKKSALIFLSSVSWSFRPNGARAEVSVDVGLSLCTGGEATRDDAGSSDEFPLRFRDDGKGMDPSVVERGGRSGHWGLPEIRERAKQIGAQLAVWSELGAGTEVELSIPGSIAYEASPTRPRFRLFRKRTEQDHEDRS